MQTLRHAVESSGHRLEATSSISPVSQLVSLPFELAITPQLVKASLRTDATIGLSDHQCMCLFLILHDLENDKFIMLGRNECHDVLDVEISLQGRHALKFLDYVRSLPRSHQMRTALWHNDAEYELLKGSNLAPAVLDRRREWQEEHASFALDCLKACSIEHTDFTW